MLFNYCYFKESVCVTGQVTYYFLIALFLPCVIYNHMLNINEHYPLNRIILWKWQVSRDHVGGDGNNPTIVE